MGKSNIQSNSSLGDATAVRFGCKTAALIIALLSVFILLQCLLPLATTIRIGGDEGFELSKALLCLKGYRLYTDVWNDQPPLHTFIITQALKHLSYSILWPRLVTSAFVLLLIASVFLIARRVNGLIVAFLTGILLIASPGFLAWGSSCMLEIPALATTVTGLSILLTTRWKSPLPEIMAGLVLGAALQIKLIGIISLPLFGLIIWLRHQHSPKPKSKFIISLGLLTVSLLLSFVAVDLLVDSGEYLAHFKQSWISHFGTAKSSEYGSASDHPFDWRGLLNNWDTAIPALLGVIFSFRLAKKNLILLVPAAWLILMLIVFVMHRPWWAYYYVHISVPLCWCGAIGIYEIWKWAASKKRRAVMAIVVLYTVCALSWGAGRLYFQIKITRESPQTYSELALNEIKRFKPYTQWMYADEPAYSFHAGIPFPPDLAVIMLKRLWSGEMTNEKIVAELTSIKPGIILLANDTRERPFRDLLNSEYRMVYEDTEVRLYVHKSIVEKGTFD